MPEERKVYQYTLHKKGFLFYDKMLMPIFEEKSFFIVRLRDYCSTVS